MKKILVFAAFLVMLAACKNEKNNTEVTKDITTEVKKDIAYKSFGDKIIADDAIAAKSMLAHYKEMNVGDSIPSKMIAKVEEVCQAKGCWMKVDLGDGEQAMVKFKDYGFFMPKNIAGKQVILNGNAYVNEVPVEELRHYAEDAGKSAAEIAEITAPKKTYSFEANGVLLVEEK
ncbi:DUF4920 domain-containing protein [Lacinutrix salivirga]